MFDEVDDVKRKGLDFLRNSRKNFGLATSLEADTLAKKRSALAKAKNL